MRFSQLLPLFLLASCHPAEEPKTSTSPDSSSSTPVASSLPTAQPTATAAPPVCEPGPQVPWENCADRLVQLKGKAPTLVAQHPMLTGPSGPGMPPSHQGYIELEGARQVIVISKEPISCNGPMRVLGTLRAVDLGGEPGTKESYRGWAVHNATVYCE